MDTGYRARAEAALLGARGYGIDRVVGEFSFARSIPFDLVRQSALAIRDAAVELATADDPRERARQRLINAWHRGARALSLIEHYLPLWGARAASWQACYGELAGHAYGVVIASAPRVRRGPRPFGLFALDAELAAGRSRPAALHARVRAAGELLRDAGRTIRAAGAIACAGAAPAVFDPRVLQQLATRPS